MSKNKKAIIYARSASKDKNSSIDKQIKICTDYSKTHDLQVLGIYTDTSTKYLAYKEAIQHAVNDGVDYIVLQKLDRMPRYIEVSLKSLSTISKYGIEIISATEDLCNFERTHPVRNLLIFTAIRDCDSQVRSMRSKQAHKHLKK